MKLAVLALSLLIALPARSQNPPVAIDDEFDVDMNGSLTVDAPGVLTNDVSDTPLVAVLISEPQFGRLVFDRDGSFTYTPDIGYTGTDVFSYIAQTNLPALFVVDDSQSGVRFSASVSTAIGSRSDSDSSGVTGQMTADIMPSAAPFSQIHITDLDMVLKDAMLLTFDFGLLGGELDVRTDPDSMQLVLARPGAPAPVSDGAFTQTDNDLNVSGTLNLDASGLISTIVPDGPQTLDETAVADLGGVITETSTKMRLELPVMVDDTLNVSGNDVAVSMRGNVTATAPLSAPLSSNVANVALVVAVGTGTDDEVLPGRFELEQNFPNPVSRMTSIGYHLPVATDITIAVYDALGRHVATLVRGIRPAGHHRTTFDAEGLPNGLYLYRIDAGEFSSAKKLVVAR